MKVLGWCGVLFIWNLRIMWRMGLFILVFMVEVDIINYEFVGLIEC